MTQNTNKMNLIWRYHQACCIVLMVMGIILAEGNILNKKVILGLGLASIAILYWTFQDRYERRRFDLRGIK